MRYVLTAILSITILAGLSACKKEMSTTAPQAEQLTVTAKLMYRERMLVPKGSTLTVMLQDVSIADKAATVISEEIIGLGEGIQLPLKVVLNAHRAELDPSHTYALHARLEGPNGNLMWITSQRHAVNIEQSHVELGDLMMQRVHSGTIGADSNDRLYPVPYKAQGNEPGWLVKVEEETIEVQTNYGQNTVKTPRPQPQPYKGGYKYHAQTEAHIAIVDIRRKLCYDNMSGRPYPNRVTLTLDGKVFEGCGGDPLSLLADHEWVVEDIAEQGIIDNSRVTITFDKEGRAYGSASCNTYNAAYQLTGENLTFKAPMSTLMACAPALMDQEQRFLKMLAQVNRYDIDGQGALILTTEGGKTITARH
ncbi:META domain-containing protein [Kangiella shandongensis]|uniref:META domain-containing protein n=1 Tax=Kangiella shandongensis TaxID=2763258 RepID=UPI001CC0300E|nr:META domain-containing protein [Kangiella shandongensis]